MLWTCYSSHFLIKSLRLLTFVCRMCIKHKFTPLIEPMFDSKTFYFSCTRLNSHYLFSNYWFTFEQFYFFIFAVSSSFTADRLVPSVLELLTSKESLPFLLLIQKITKNKSRNFKDVQPIQQQKHNWAHNMMKIGILCKVVNLLYTTHA